jgi:hypothetical protein
MNETLAEFNCRLAVPPPRGWRYWTKWHTPRFVGHKIKPDPHILAQTAEGRLILYHELKHFEDAVTRPGRYYFASVSKAPGAGFAHVIMETRGYLQSHGLRGLNPKYALASIRKVGREGLVYRDAAITLGLGVTGYISYYVVTRV